MEDNVLKVRLVADTEGYEKDMRDAGRATEKFGDDSKKSSTALEKLQKTIEEQKTRLKALKNEYADLVLTQDKSDKSTKDLESKMKLLNTQLLINQKRLQAVNAASGAFTTGLGGEQANESMKELYSTMESIRNLQFADLILNSNFLNNLKNVKSNFKDMSEHLKDAKGHLKDALGFIGHVLNPKNAKEGGYPYFQGIFDKRNWKGDMGGTDALNELKAAAASAGQGFKALGTTIKGAMTGAVAAIASVVAVVVGLVSAIKNAIRTAQQLKTALYQASTLGLETNEYLRLSYILESVGESADDLADAIKTLSSEQAILAEGSEGNTEAFKRLGMSVDDILGMNQEELFTKTIKGLQNIEDQVERTTLAYQIFGEDTAARLANVLYMTNEEMDRLTENFYLLGGGVTDSAIQKSTNLSYAIQNLKLAWQGLTRTLGEAFMPVVTAVVKWLTLAVAKVNMFIRAMLGYDIIAKNTGEAANNAESYGKAIENATKATEKLKRSTQGFDELNIVTNPANSSSAAGYLGAGGGVTSDLEKFNASLNQELNLAKFAESMEKFKNIIKNVMPWALIGVGILLCFLGGPVGWITGLGLMGLGIAVGIESGAWGEQITAVGEAMKSACRGIKNWFVDKVLPFFTKEYWKARWDNISQAVANSTVGQAISKGWTAIEKWYGENIAPVFTKDFWKQKFENIRSATAEKMDGIQEKVSEKWGVMKQWFAGNVAPVFTKDYWKQKWENVRSATAEKMNEVQSKLNEKWGAVKKWFGETVAPIFTQNYWKNKWENFRLATANKLEEVKAGIMTKWEAIKSFWNVYIHKIFTKDFWKKKWETAKEGAIDGVKSFINSIITKIETGINSIVRKINGIGKIDFPEWLGGGSFGGFNLKTIYIPRLASGGIVTGSTLANIGERGKEAVLPLENNTGWMDMLADRIAARSNMPSKIVLQVGEKELGWAAIDTINDITAQTGRFQLHIL